MKKILLLFTILILFSACAKQPADLAKDEADNQGAQNEFSLVFSNIKYRYSFSFPSNATIWNNNMGGDIQESPNLSVHLSNLPNALTVEVKNPEDYKERKDKELYEHYSKPLDEYVKNLWQINKKDKIPQNKSVSDIEALSFNGIPSYKFDLTGSYQSTGRSGYMLDEKRTFIFFKNDGLIYEINFPSDKEELTTIADTFKLSNTFEDMDQKNIENCQKTYESTKDSCLLAYVNHKIYHRSNLNNYDICKNITVNSAQQNQCYWMFAMAIKDKQICKFLTAKDYFSENSCKAELEYVFEDSKWKLGSGIPPYNTNDGIVYFGESEIKGWIEEKANDKLIYFHPAESEFKKFPPYLQQYKKYTVEYDMGNRYVIGNFPEEILSSFREYSEKNPMLIFTQRVGISKNKTLPEITITKLLNHAEIPIIELDGNNTVDPNLPRNILSRLYYSEDTSEDLKKCEKFTDPKDKGKCYWIVAMKTRDSKFCDLIPKDANEKEKKCATQIHFKSPKGDYWDLEKGFPPYGDPVTLIYKGKATLNGGILYKSYYSKDLAHFHVENTESIPIPNQEFLLISEDKNVEEAIKKLKVYNESSPATIIVDKLVYPWDGPTILNVVEIATPAP